MTGSAPVRSRSWKPLRRCARTLRRFKAHVSPQRLLLYCPHSARVAMKRLLCLSLLACCVLSSTCVAQTSTTKGRYLFVWAGDAARKNSDFLSVLGADPASPDYGRVVATVPVKTTGNMPHHTEYEFPADNQLFAEGWATGTTYIFDLANPAKPR